MKAMETPSESMHKHTDENPGSGFKKLGEISMKTYGVIIDHTDSFICPVKANSKEEALEKAKGVIPFENNVPHYSETKVIGIDQEWSE